MTLVPRLPIRRSSLRLSVIVVRSGLKSTAAGADLRTGVVADVYSRRLSILTGITLIGCGYALEGGIPEFWAALGSKVFWGVG